MSNYKKLRQKLEKANATAFRQTEMREHYEELYKVSVNELKFAHMQKGYMDNLIMEVEVLVKKGLKASLISAVIKNGRERMMIDTSIHYFLIK